MLSQEHSLHPKVELSPIIMVVEQHPVVHGIMVGAYISQLVKDLPRRMIFIGPESNGHLPCLILSTCFHFFVYR